MSEFQPADRARDSGGAPAYQTVAGRLAGGIEVHVVASASRGRFPKVDKCRPAIGKTGQQKTAAPNVAGEGMRYRQGERHGNGCVNGVTAGLQHCYAGIGGVGLLRHHHRLSGPHWFACR